MFLSPLMFLQVGTVRSRSSMEWVNAGLKAFLST